MAAVRLNATQRSLLRTPVCLYRLKCGWLLGHRFLMLIQVGRRTGLRRYTVLEVMEYRKGLPEAVVMSGFGRHPDWLRNLEPRSGSWVIACWGRIGGICRYGDGKAEYPGSPIG